MCDFAGRPAALDDSPAEAPLFYGTFALVTVTGLVLVLLPGVSLVPLLIGTQVVNAVLLLPLLGYMSGIARDRRLMGEFTAPRAVAAVYWVAVALITACIVALGVLSIRH